MAKRVTALRVAALKTPGLNHVGDGLYLRITPKGGRTWVFRYMHQRIAHSMGLGSCSLSDARAKVSSARALLDNNQDPLARAKADRLAKAAELASTTTFKQAATQFIDDHKSGWKNSKHAAQWTATLEAYVYPVFGNVSVTGIDTPMVLKVLKPIWSTKTETAMRVRGRIEAVLDWAKVHEMRSGENPARWRGGLQHALPAKPQSSLVKHHPALPYSEMAEFMAALRAEEGAVARCLEFTILTAARTSEAIGATWSEVDLKAATWIIPASRIKAAREHRVPLSPAALALLKAQAKIRQGDLSSREIRAGLVDQHNGRPADHEAGGHHVHGFRPPSRTAFRTDDHRAGVGDGAGAVSDKVEAAQGHPLAKRRSDELGVLWMDGRVNVGRLTAPGSSRNLTSRRRRVVRVLTIDVGWPSLNSWTLWADDRWRWTCCNTGTTLQT